MTSFSTSIIACSFALAAAGLVAAPSFAAEPNKQNKPAKSRPVAKAKAVHPKAEELAIAAGPDADITDTTTTDYSCELGNKLTIFTNEKDDSHIALRWKKRIHRLNRVGTTPGALRFENTTFGLIWIGIPSKGMLLDAKQNRQLANECKNADQAAGNAATSKPAGTVSAKVIEKVEPILPLPPTITTPTPPAPITPL